jgi:hypothetical protein
MAKLRYACVLTRQIDRIASLYQEMLQLVPQRDGAYVEVDAETANCSLADLGGRQ